MNVTALLEISLLEKAISKGSLVLLVIIQIMVKEDKNLRIVVDFISDLERREGICQEFVVVRI